MTAKLPRIAVERPAKAIGKNTLSAMQSGDLLIAECTDPLTAIDIPNLLNQTGDTLEESSRDGKVLVFRIRKK